MIDRELVGFLGALALFGCVAGSSSSASAARQIAGRYTSLDPAKCRLLELNEEEGGYSRHLCPGVGGYKLETSESDLRQDIVVIAPRGRPSALQLSTLVANGAFNSLGNTAEWRGSQKRPAALIVRLSVSSGEHPERPPTSNLVVVRLAPRPCVTAIVPPGAGQNERARRLADERSKCLQR
jgi:hypothetical protein